MPSSVPGIDANGAWLCDPGGATVARLFRSEKPARVARCRSGGSWSIPRGVTSPNGRFPVSHPGRRSQESGSRDSPLSAAPPPGMWRPYGLVLSKASSRAPVGPMRFRGDAAYTACARPHGGVRLLSCRPRYSTESNELEAQAPPHASNGRGWGGSISTDSPNLSSSAVLPDNAEFGSSSGEYPGWVNRSRIFTQSQFSPRVRGLRNRSSSHRPWSFVPWRMNRRYPRSNQ